MNPHQPLTSEEDNMSNYERTNETMDNLSESLQQPGEFSIESATALSPLLRACVVVRDLEESGLYVIAVYIDALSRRASVHLMLDAFNAFVHSADIGSVSTRKHDETMHYTCMFNGVELAACGPFE